MSDSLRLSRSLAAVATGFLFVLMVAATHAAQAQTFTILHNFTGGEDGASPIAALTMDNAGSLYGTASIGGSNNCPGGCGTVFKLTKKGSGWVFLPLYSFAGGSDGAYPLASVVFGPDGSLYSTTGGGANPSCTNGCGTVFKLRPNPTACKTALCGWQESLLYSFTGGSDGANPGYGSLVFDQAGNIYGTTVWGGPNNCFGVTCGVVYELTASDGGWTESVIYAFSGGQDGWQPSTGVIFDQAGNHLYGTTNFGGNPSCFNDFCGTVFQLTTSQSGWTENILYDFQNGSDGTQPTGGLVFDQSGNLYGTTQYGGSGLGGTVFALTPSGGSWTYGLLYSFEGFPGNPGGGPYGSLVMDAAGDLYGSTALDGAYGWGSVFKLTPSNGGWAYTDLYDFCSGGSPCTDGAVPFGVMLDASGNLYGVTSGGGTNGLGVVWEITP